MTSPDELDLPGARQALRDAIHALIGRTRTLIHRDDGSTTPVWSPPLYAQLRDYIAGAQGTGHGSHARSMPPVVVDAVDLCDQIDRTVKTWDTDLRADTVMRLEMMDQAMFRPQDVPWLRDRTADLTWWAVQVRNLLDPPRRWTLPNPCPACGTSKVHRPDSAGETVRQPALQIGMHGCECQSCRTFWPPEAFGILAGAITEEKTA